MGTYDTTPASRMTMGRHATCLYVILNTMIINVAPFQPFPSAPFTSKPRLSLEYKNAVRRTGSSLPESSLRSSSVPDLPKGNNWIERSAPMGLDMDVDEDGAEEYSIGIDGESFELASLSLRMYDALMSVASKRFPDGDVPSDLLNVYKVYAMDLAAKEAVTMAMKQNELELIVDSAEESWGNVEMVKMSNGSSFDSLEDAASLGGLEPGVSFSFVVQNALCKPKSMELDLKDLLDQLDPDGAIRGDMEAMTDQEDIQSLADFEQYNEKRCNRAPVLADLEGFKGDYQDSDNENENENENEGNFNNKPIPAQLLTDAIRDPQTTKWIMANLESQTCLIVRLTEEQAPIMHRMWKATTHFFQNTDSPGKAPPMTQIPDSGSKHAVVGYAEYDEGQMKFMETRMERSTNTVQPPNVIEDKGAMEDAFHTIAHIGKLITNTAIAAASIEANAFDTDQEAEIKAKLVTDVFLDDGKPSNLFPNDDTKICMSPHRMCRYSNDKTSKDAKGGDAREIFGAHTDTSFITAVPVAAVDGLEVYDETQNVWIRPELIAKAHWESTHPKKNDKDDADAIPWHCHYLVCLPGELMQIVTRGMIPSSVHRVIAVKDKEARVSCPVLLRARSNAKVDVYEYFGEDDNVIGQLLLDCDMMNMEEVHDALQPGSTQ